MELFVWFNFFENYFKLIIFKLSHLLSCSLNYFSDQEETVLSHLKTGIKYCLVSLPTWIDRSTNVWDIKIMNYGFKLV